MHELIEFLHQNYAAKAIGLSLLHSLWQGAAIAALLWVLLKTLGSLGARIRYMLSLSALCGLLLCFGFTIYLQLQDKLQPISEDLVHVIVAEDFSNAVAPAAEERSIFQKIEIGWNAFNYWLHQHVVYFFLAWAFGFFLFSFRFFTGLHYLKVLKQSSSPLPDIWSVKLETLKQLVGLNKNICLLTSDRISTPLTFGWLKPVIIFPISMLSLLPADQVESILLHELAHIRRNDYLLNLVQSIVEAIFFFNPGYWFISSLLERERELICDDMVVASTSNAQTYARALTRLAEFANDKNHRLALNIAREKGSLFFRIKRIINPTDPTIMEKAIKRRSYQIASVIIACSLFIFLTIEVNGSENKRIKEKNESLPKVATSDISVSGSVLAKYGAASLSGVAIRIKHTNKGTTTDKEGAFKIDARASDTLLFSFPGYHNKEVGVAQTNYHVVVLESIEKPIDSKVVIERIEVKQHDDNEKATSNAQHADAQKKGRIFIVPEEASLNTFHAYISDPSIQELKFDKGKEISLRELESLNKESIKSRLTISSEQTGSLRAVTIVKLKDKEEVATKVVEDLVDEIKPQPLYILLREGVFTAENSDEYQYKLAFEKGVQIEDAAVIEPTSLASVHVLKGKQATEYFGEAGKHGIVFMTLKNSAQDAYKALIKENTSPEAIANQIEINAIEPKIKEDDSFQVYPNPADKLIKVRILIKEKQQVSLEAVGPNGKKVYTFVDRVLEKGVHEFEWNAAAQQAGLYTIKLKNSTEARTKKLVLKN